MKISGVHELKISGSQENFKRRGGQVAAAAHKTKATVLYLLDISRLFLR